MIRSRRRSGLLALLVIMALAAGACGSDEEQSGSVTTQSEDETEAADVPQGGTATFGAEQELATADWMSLDAGSSWGAWPYAYQTMPRSFEFVADGDSWVYEPSTLLTGEPELIESPKQVITYKINPAAKWSDGTPITSKDFRYTWDQVKNGSDIYDRTGYAEIESVDDSRPDTAVVTFAQPFAAWRALFGGQYGIYPAHILDGKDRNALMKDGYTWSGGPWKMESWNKGVDLTLVRNDAWWGEKAKLDKVVFKFITDTAAQFQAFKAGEVLAIYPQPQIATVDAMKAGGLDATQIVSANTANFEALWMNNEKAPFNSKAVRQAVAYSIDRDAIVKALFGGIEVDKALNTLGAPILGDYFDLDAFSDYRRDQAKVDELMKGDGWARGGDGIWAKGGQKASFEINSTAGNKRRELTEQVLQQQLKEAGFDMTIENVKSGDLFGTLAPQGDFQMGLYAQVQTDLDPATCELFCSKNIPTAANGNSGNNWTRTNIPALDEQLLLVDTSLDESDRQEAGKAADEIMAEEVVSLPLDPLPNIGLVSKQIVGPIEDNPITSVFGNMHQWGLAG